MAERTGTVKTQNILFMIAQQSILALPHLQEETVLFFLMGSKYISYPRMKGFFP